MNTQTSKLVRGAARLMQWTPVRTLGERHRERVAAHLLALDDADRQLRFGHLASDERIRSYVAQLDFQRDALFGVFNRRLAVVAMAHLAMAGDSGTSEFGVSVNAGLRGRGLGSQLFEHAVTHARNRGAHTMLIHLARDNAAMLGIVRKAGAAVRFEGSDVLAELPLPADTLGSQIQELLAHQAGEFDYRMKLQVLRLDASRPHTG
jgi:ribosomal protein S18 acetylase RimI-like enzyme